MKINIAATTAIPQGVGSSHDLAEREDYPTNTVLGDQNHLTLVAIEGFQIFSQLASGMGAGRKQNQVTNLKSHDNLLSSSRKTKPNNPPR
jgi:hypothetical protein